MKNIPLFLSCALLSLLTACANLSATEMYKHQPPAQIHQTARNYMADHDYTEAAQAYEALDALHPYHAHAEEAQHEMVMAYTKMEDFATTIAVTDRYLHFYPRGRYADHVYLLKGEAEMNQDRPWFIRYLPVDASSRDLTNEQRALKDFKMLVQRFPHSAYAAQARDYIKTIEHHTVQAELNVAQYYLRRHVYVGAANRAAYILEHYPHSYAVPQAMQILAQAHHALGLT